MPGSDKDALGLRAAASPPALESRAGTDRGISLRRLAMKQWYYLRAGVKVGPFTSSEMRRLAASGTLKPGDLIQQAGTLRWARAVQVRGLFPAAGPPSLPHDARRAAPPPPPL